jgi:hypothetical protein
VHGRLGLRLAAAGLAQAECAHGGVAARVGRQAGQRADLVGTAIGAAAAGDVRGGQAVVDGAALAAGAVGVGAARTALGVGEAGERQATLGGLATDLPGLAIDEHALPFVGIAGEGDLGRRGWRRGRRGRRGRLDRDRPGHRRRGHDRRDRRGVGHRRHLRPPRLHADDQAEPDRDEARDRQPGRGPPRRCHPTPLRCSRS